MDIKKIAASLATIAATGALLGGATYAFFSDTGTATNTFGTGELVLKLTDANEVDQDDVTATFGGSNLAPGSCTGNKSVTLKNTGTIAANHDEVHLGNVVTDAGNNASSDIDAFMRINLLTYDAVDVTGKITDTNGNGFKDLADWAASATALDNLALTNLNVG